MPADPAFQDPPVPAAAPVQDPQPVPAPAPVQTPPPVPAPSQIPAAAAPAQNGGQNVADGTPDSTDFARDSRIGRHFILPGTFYGSRRALRREYQDAMAQCIKEGYPDLFLTFTCNKDWQEIKDAVAATGGQVKFRPDIVSRVFKLKLDELMKDLTTNCVFGVAIAHIRVIEFQKRGLPHAHILITLDAADKIKNSTALIDLAVWAELPDKERYPRLYDIVTRTMLHGPCGDHNPGLACMRNNRRKCSKRYPKRWCEETRAPERGIPEYRRREDGRVFEKVN